LGHHVDILKILIGKIYIFIGNVLVVFLPLLVCELQELISFSPSVWAERIVIIGKVSTLEDFVTFCANQDKRDFVAVQINVFCLSLIFLICVFNCGLGVSWC